MQETKRTARSVILAWRLAALLTAALAAGQAQAYDHFSGAWASPGAGGDCPGYVVAQGIDPYGGCTPGIYSLNFATAFVYSFSGNNYYATATADISKASVFGSSYFPAGVGNHPGAAANFMDRLTVVGPLPTPVDIVVTLTIDSTIRGEPGSDSEGGQPLSAWLFDGSGKRASFVRSDSDGGCYWPRVGGSLCDEGYGHTVRTITEIETLSDANRSFWVGTRLNVGNGGQRVDASATISLALPDGLSYTSGSGVFPLPTVPEPATGALMLAGLAAVGWGARMRVIRQGAVG